MKIYLIRHGQKDRTLTRIAPHKVGLTETGKLQAQAFAQYATQLDIGKIYTSPYLRTRETAMPVERELGLKAEESKIIAEVGVKEYLNLLRHQVNKNQIQKFEKEFITDLLSLT